MKKQLLLSAVSMALLAPAMTPISTLAVETNNSSKRDISSEAYSSFDSLSKNFSALQANYGNLGSSNMSPGYKEYLNTISKNKANTALNYKLAAQQNGKYSISENGLVLKSDEAEKLVDALFSDDESKKDMLTNKNDNEGANLSDKLLENNAFGGNYINDKNEFGNKTDNAIKENNDKYNKEHALNQDKGNQSASEAKKMFEDALKKAKEAGKKGESMNGSVVKNYNSVQKQLETEQNKYSEEEKKVSLIAFNSKVDGYEEAKKHCAANGVKAEKLQMEANKLNKKPIKYSPPKKSDVGAYKHNHYVSSLRKEESTIKKNVEHAQSTSNYSKAPILRGIKNLWNKIF